MSRFETWPRGLRVGGSSAREAWLSEIVLARARVYLAIASLAAIYLDPTEPSRYARLAYGLLATYAAYAVLVLVAASRGRDSSRHWGLAVHGLDIAWAALLSLFTEGPSSPFFLFFIFVLLSAAYRWGSRGTLVTGAIAVALVAAEALILSRPGRWLDIEGEFELNRLLMRAVYLVIIARLLGYLGGEEKRLRWEAAATAQVLRRIQAQSGLRKAIQGFFDEALSLFPARAVLLAVREIETGRAFLWEGRRAGDSGVVAHVGEIAGERQNGYLFESETDAWWAARGAGVPLLSLDARGERLRTPRDPLPQDLLSGEGFGSVLAASFRLGEEWTGRIFLVDPAGRPQENDLRFLQRLFREAAPALQNADLLRRLRSRAGAVERARVARELHDGVIQSLIGLEMQVDVLRRQAIERNYATGGALTHIQALLRDEVLAVRELMQQMKPVEIVPTELLDHVAGQVERFRNETGIAASFVSSQQEVNLPPRLCREVVRIVQEALVNVRKHSGARNVVVRLERGEPGWSLAIDDDGRGFGFTGRLSQSELEASRKGPVVIKERVRSFGGAITVESHPGRGSRLEITLPGRFHG